MRLLRAADVIVVHEATASLFREHFNASAEVVEPGTVNPVTLARSGRLVARIFVGDPGIGSVMADEAKACVKGRVPFEIVPGISAVSGVPAYTGIPLTDGKQPRRHGRRRAGGRRRLERLHRRGHPRDHRRGEHHR
jgi:Uroporphyrinogen-III methylase